MRGILAGAGKGKGLTKPGGNCDLNILCSSCASRGECRGVEERLLVAGAISFAMGDWLCSRKGELLSSRVGVRFPDSWLEDITGDCRC